MTKVHAEVLLRDISIKILKTLTGKGPKITNVKIVKNFIVIEFKEILTNMEKRLLEVEDSSMQIMGIRSGIETIMFEDYITQLKDLFKVNVADIVSKLNIEKDEYYLLVVLDKDLEERYQ